MLHYSVSSQKKKTKRSGHARFRDAFENFGVRVGNILKINLINFKNYYPFKYICVYVN